MHRDLAQRLSIVPGDRFEGFLADLKRMAASVAESREVDDRMRARVMAMGELLATALGAVFLNAQGIETAWVDAREALRAEQRHDATLKAGLLSATCDFAPDDELQARWRALERVVITQGFIAANDAGDTVLLGRGGSDTSGAYFAAKLDGGAPRNLDRRAGDVQRQSARRARRRGCCARCITMKRRKSRATARRCCIRAACCRCASTRFRCMSMPRRRPDSRARSSPRTSPAVRRRSRRSRSRRASRWSRWTARACGIRWDFSPMPSRSSSSRACRSTSFPPRRPTSPCRSIRPPIRSIRRRSSGSRRPWASCAGSRCSARAPRLSLLGHNIRGILHELGRGVRVVPGPQDLPGQPGGERPELHLRDRRVPGRPSGASIARAADPEHRLRQGARADLAAAVLAAAKPRGARRQLVGGACRSAAGCSTSPRANRRRSSTTSRAWMPRSRRCGACARSRAGPTP